MKVSFDGLTGGGIEGKKRTMQAEAQLKKLREQKKRILEETGSTETYKQIETSRTIDAATKNVDTNSFERGQGQGVNKGGNGQPAGAINSSTPPASTNTPPAQPQPATTSTTGGGEGSVARTINSQTDMVRMIIPQFRRIGDQFGWRVHPITHTRKFHKGIDIPAPEGSPIYSPMSGRIVYAQNISKAPRTGGGNAIRINHQQGLDTVYMHLSKFNVASGQMVNKGQLIGYAGSTGGSTGSHLHFQVERNGIPVDPTNLVQYMGGTPAAGDDAPIAKLRTDFPVGSSAAKMAAGAGDDLAINLNKDKMLANALGGAVSESNIGQNNIIVVNGGNSTNVVSSKSSNNPVIGGQGNGGLMNYYLGVV
jgi:murein DD-endopeptidase MepM/ murein hydrolase activator NlpD